MDEDLNAFRGDDEEAARQSFDRLWLASRPGLLKRLIYLNRSSDFADEVLQRTGCRLWDARHSFKPGTMASWRAYIRVIANNVAIDLRREQSGRCKHETELFENSGTDTSDFRHELYIAIMSQRAYWLANLHWLGLDPAGGETVHRRQILVATRHFIDGEELDEIAATMPTPPKGEPAITVALLREWMHHPGVLRHFIFRTLYMGNEPLALHMLGLRNTPDNRALLAALARNAARESGQPAEPTLQGRAPLEAAAAVWRYLFAMTPDQIWTKYRLQLDRWGADRKQLGELCALLAVREPFKDKALQLKNAFDAMGSKLGADLLCEDRVWRRLVFQYEYHDDVPMPDILGRVLPAAMIVKFTVTESMVNSWTNGKQLVKQLVRSWRKEFEGDFDE